MIKLLQIKQPNTALVTYPVHALFYEHYLRGGKLTIFNVYSGVPIIALSAEDESQKEKLIDLHGSLDMFIASSPANLALLCALDPSNPTLMILGTYEPENSRLRDKIIEILAAKLGIPRR